MKKILMLSFFILLLAGKAQAFGKGAQAGSGECAGCHIITKDEATAVINKIDPSINVSNIENIYNPPAKGLFEVVLKSGNKTGVVYLDYSKKYMFIGKMIDIENKIDLTMEKQDAATVIDISKISLESSILLGDSLAKEKLLVFSDPDCSFCQRLHSEITELLQENKQLGVYIFLFGLDMHPNAGWKSTSVICKSKENMGDGAKMLDAAYHGKDIPKVECGINYNEINKKLSRELGVDGTPAIILSNGKLIMGFKTKDELKALLK